MHRKKGKERVRHRVKGEHVGITSLASRRCLGSKKTAPQRLCVKLFYIRFFYYFRTNTQHHAKTKDPHTD